MSHQFLERFKWLDSGLPSARNKGQPEGIISNKCLSFYIWIICLGSKDQGSSDLKRKGLVMYASLSIHKLS